MLTFYLLRNISLAWRLIDVHFLPNSVAGNARGFFFGRNLLYKYLLANKGDPTHLSYFHMIGRWPDHCGQNTDRYDGN